MLLKRPARNKLFDRLHKGVVLTCVGLTLIGTYMLSERWYRYFTEVRPQIKLKHAEREKELLSEGRDLVNPAPAILSSE